MAREAFDESLPHPAFGLPTSADPETPRVYAYPHLLALGLVERMTQADPGRLYLLFGTLSGIVFLRLAIARMAEHEAAYNPMTFAVWYEHLAGINAALSEALGQALRRRLPIEDERIRQLYREHVTGMEQHGAQAIARMRGVEDRRHGAKLGEQREQRGGLTVVVGARRAIGGVRVEHHQVHGLRAKRLMERVPVGDFDQLVVSREDGAESRQRSGGQSSGHMHERDGAGGWRNKGVHKRRKTAVVARHAPCRPSLDSARRQSVRTPRHPTGGPS
jgi:hypothetical protein